MIVFFQGLPFLMFAVQRSCSHSQQNKLYRIREMMAFQEFHLDSDMPRVKTACAGLKPRFLSVTFDSLEGVVGRKEFTYSDMDEHSRSVFSVFFEDGSMDKFGTGLAIVC